MQAVRARLSYANVIATIALFLALGGSAYAVTAGKNTVKSKSIAKGAVKTTDIANKAVSGAKLKPGAVSASAIANGSIGATQLGKVVIRRGDGTIPEGNSGAARASCKPGEKVLGGGGSVGAIDVNQFQSTPFSADGSDPKDGNSPGGWVVVFYNPIGGSGTASALAWVLCLQ